MDTIQVERTDAGTQDVFSLPSLLDSSAALAAARRLYAGNRTGVRFFCENRRVVPVHELDEAALDPTQADGAPAN